MRKLLLLTCLIIGTLSCTKEKSTDLATDAKTQLSTDEGRALLVQSIGKTKLNYDQAMDCAHHAMQLLDANKPVLTRGARTIGNVTPIVDKTLVKTRSGETQTIEDTTMYIVNFADQQGYAVISTSMLTSNMIASVEEGSLESLDDMVAGKQPMLYYAMLSQATKQQFMIDHFDSLVMAAKNKVAEMPTNESSAIGTRYDFVDGNGFGYNFGEWTPTTGGSAALTTRWGAGKDFTKQISKPSCGHAANVGSATVAMAQVIASPLFKTYFQWVGHMASYIGDDNNIDVSFKSIDAIQKLYLNITKGCPISLKCDDKNCVNNNAKNPALISVIDYLKSLDINAKGYRIANGNQAPMIDLMGRLKKVEPILMTGATESDLYDSYYWIADGCSNSERTVWVYTVSNNQFQFSYTDTESEIIHCNMGQYGRSNGFYAFGMFDLSAPVFAENERLENASGSYPYNITYVTLK